MSCVDGSGRVISSVMPRVALWMALTAAWGAVCGAAPDQPFDITQSTLSHDSWEALSTLLVDYAQARVQDDPAFAKDQRFRKLVKIAYLISPQNRPAVLLHAKLKQQLKIPPPQAAVDSPSLLAKLLETAHAAKAAGSAADTQAARHLFALGLVIEPRHEDCLFESELFTAQHGPIDWEALLAEYVHVVQASDGFQQAINGLVVMTVNHAEVGQVAKILLTYSEQSDAKKKKEGLDIVFARDVGEHMVVSLDEAVRYWNRYAAGRRLQTGKIEISFEDKYTPKDGGSAGAAYAVLIHSFMHQFRIDEQFAMTGDISVEGKVLQIGGVFAKIRGAHVDGCTRVAIPQSNVEELIDHVIIHGPDILKQIEIFSLETVDDAIELARQDKPNRCRETHQLWLKLAPRLEDEAWQGSDEVKTILDDILALCPNHVSASLLADLAHDTMRQHVSLSQSILHLNGIFRQYLIAISLVDKPSFKDIPGQTDTTHIDQAIADLEAAQGLVDSQAQAACAKLLTACETIARFTRLNQQLENQEKILQRKHDNIEGSKRVLDRMKSQLRTDSRASVTRYNAQVNRVNRAINQFENERDRLNDRIRQRNELLAEVFQTYLDYYSTVQALTEDPKILEKLIRGQ